MNREQNNFLVPSEAMYILVGTMVGIGIFSLSNTLVKSVHEDAWISAALGGIYPLYVGSIGIYMIKRHPSENILDLSKRYMGKVIGTLLNILFLVFFILNTCFVISEFSIIYQVYATAFLTPLRIISITTLMSAVTAYRGLKVVGRVNTVAFYVTMILLLETFAALRKGSYLNLMPVFDAGVINIVKSSKDAVFSYAGLEILFIIYPYVKNNSRMSKEITKATSIAVLIYTLTTAVTIYYLSADIVEKSYWPLITASESLRLTVINNFRIIFAFFWIFVALKSSTNYYFASAFICGNIFKKVKRKNIIGVLYLIIVPITLVIGESTVRNKVIGMIIGKITIFNLIYITVVAFFIFIKKGVKDETS
ncbi:spore germination protein (amino acid permease) [Clostridium pascui]|uniref:GerAB/ArcD/ProY family transporter n=1 Tax=Clostridium pascui TaxID=46609 RepID=UPI00195C758E|nr:spore germination protein (amino acid permease) [Clostridium pascui]